jgi:DNA recombination protein RmuC
MLIPILILQIVILIALVFLLVRKSPAPKPDAHLAQLTDALPAQLTRLDARSEALDHHLRSELAQLRTDNAAEARRTRDSAATDFTTLRTEITTNIAELSKLLNTGLNGFRTDNKASDEVLRSAVQRNLESIEQRLSYFIAEANRNQLEAREALHSRLTELSGEANTQQEKLRFTVEDRLTKLNEDNAAKLEQMRVTVDEKLHATLQTRLTESFGQVTDQLNKVHTGLGEMTKLSDGVNDLSRIFTNVKARGGFAEVQLGMLLEQMLAPSQYLRNAKVKDGTQEVVEFAVRFPGPAGETLLPIDAKFPREDWERLEAAYESNQPDTIAAAGRAFESAIRTEGDRICKKYINPPVTTPHAIMFLPTEGLYAEVMRRDSLQAEIQSKCHVTIAGPSTLSAILTSFQMGFHMLALQEKGDEVWKVLQSTKTEFGKFGTLMDKVGNDLLKVHGKLTDVGVRTRAINRALREVGESDSPAPANNLLGFDELPGVAPLLAASSDEE